MIYWGILGGMKDVIMGCIPDCILKDILSLKVLDGFWSNSDKILITSLLDSGCEHAGGILSRNYRKCCFIFLMILDMLNGFWVNTEWDPLSVSVVLDRV